MQIQDYENAINVLLDESRELILCDGLKAEKQVIALLTSAITITDFNDLDNNVCDEVDVIIEDLARLYQKRLNRNIYGGITNG